MIWLKRKKLQLISVLLVFLGCSNNPDRVSIIYLFDTSGSFHTDALPYCIDLSEKIFEEMTDPNGSFQVFPQIHQVSSIDESSVEIGIQCSEEVEQPNLFSPSKEEASLEDCLTQVRKSKRASYTDLKGALYNASQALQFKNAFKAIIVFSDLHENVPKQKVYTYDLNGVSVFVIHEVSNEQRADPQLIEKDKKSFVNILLEKGVKKNDIEIKSLKTIGQDPTEVVNFLRQPFFDK